MKTWRTDLDNMIYIIRDEGIHSMSSLKSGYSSQRLVKAQSMFVNQLKSLIENIFKDATIKVASLDEQIESAKIHLKGKRTISLDTYFKGDYNLEITRLFNIINGKTEFNQMTNREGSGLLIEQIAKIEPGEYVLVDDDAVGGATIRAIKSLMPNDVKIVDTYLLMNMYRNESSEPILDVVDSRDFIAGLQGSGLTVQLKDIGVIRVPYMYPFVDIDDKANIPDGLEIEVSQRLWKLNQEFWNMIDSGIRLKDVGTDFIKLSLMFGIDIDTPMDEVCNIYYKLSEQGILINT